MHSIYKKTVIIMLIISILLLLFLLDDKEEQSSLSRLLATATNEQVYRDFSLLQDNNVTVHGVLDRIEGEKAVILIEELNEQWIVPKKQLPKQSKQQMWFNIQHEGDKIQIISIDQEKTDKEREKSEHLIKKLKKEK